MNEETYIRKLKETAQGGSDHNRLTAIRALADYALGDSANAQTARQFLFAYIPQYLNDGASVNHPQTYVKKNLGEKW